MCYLLHESTWCHIHRDGQVAEGSSTDRTETTEQLSDFTPRKGDQGYVDSDDEEAEFSPRAMEQSLALSPKCKVAVMVLCID